MSRILITTLGSLGDVHPFLAIGLELQRRGHDVVVATCVRHQRKIESLRLKYHILRPDIDWLDDPRRMQRLSHRRWGLLRVGSEWLMPALRESYEDTLNAAKGADLLIGMHAAYATRLVAEKTGIPWVSAVHIPMGFFSAFDPPILDFAPDVSRWLRGLGSGFWRSVFWISKRFSRPMARLWYQLRKEIGLPPTAEGNPLADSHSPQLVLALFSKAIADRQPDWPQQTNITGFPFFDADRQDLPDSINEFLDAGPPPIVFTLGSAVSMNPGLFYETSAKCSVLLGHRAILVTGKSNLPQLPWPASVIAVEYAPFSTLFPRAAAIVHHGGIGTTAMAMRAGRPMLIVPRSWDQPDNGHRAGRLGIARILSKRQFTPKRAAVELRQLLYEPSYQQRASRVQQQIQAEDGSKAACDVLEKLLMAVSLNNF